MIRAPRIHLIFLPRIFLPLVCFLVPHISLHCWVMKRREFQGLADAHCEMAVSERLAGDLETLCQLPDGRVDIDLVHGTAGDSASGPVSLKIVSELHAWLMTRVAGSGATVTAANVEITFR